MAERQLVQIPPAPSPAVGIAGSMPGAQATVVPHPVQVGSVRISDRVPQVLQQPGGVLQDPSTAMAPHLAKAQAITSAGREISRELMAIGEKITENYESAQLLHADTQWKRAWGEYQSNLPYDPDSWKEGWDKRSAKIKTDWLGDERKLTPDLKQRLELNFEAFDAGVRNSLDSMTYTRKNHIANALYEESIQDAVERRDLGRIRDILTLQVSNGHTTKELASERMKHFETRIFAANAYDEVEQDPRGALEMLRDPENLPDWLKESPGDISKLTRHARIALNAKQSDQSESINAWIATHQSAPESELDAVRPQIAPDLDDGQWQKLKVHAHQLRPSTPEAWLAMHSDVIALTEKDAKEHPEKIHAMRTRIRTELNPTEAGDMLHALSASIGDHSEYEIHRLMSVELKTMDGDFKAWRREARPKGMSTADWAPVEKAARREYADDLQKHLQEHPKETWREIDAWRKGWFEKRGMQIKTEFDSSKENAQNFLNQNMTQPKGWLSRLFQPAQTAP